MDKDIQCLKKELDDLKLEIESIKTSLKNSKSNNKELDKKIDDLKKEVRELNNQIITYMAKNDTSTIVKEIADELLKNTLENSDNNNTQMQEQLNFMKKIQSTFVFAAISIVLAACSLIFPQIPNILKILS